THSVCTRLTPQLAANANQGRLARNAERWDKICVSCEAAAQESPARECRDRESGKSESAFSRRHSFRNSLDYPGLFLKYQMNPSISVGYLVIYLGCYTIVLIVSEASGP